jgi:hypothetical protein
MEIVVHGIVPTNRGQNPSAVAAFAIIYKPGSANICKQWITHERYRRTQEVDAYA